MALKEILESIRRPHRVTFEAKDLTPSYGKFIAQPFERGYAVTVGNALRRVLLSSIPGYAIAAIKIYGVSNEFENVPGMKEDTIVMIMHLKPDYYIATIAEGYTFEMDIQIEGGYSYVPAELNMELVEDVNAIAIDAIYSPILSVKYSVDDIRVGQRIDYGRLTLEIETKGNVAPEKALSWAAKILRENLTHFMQPEEANGDDGKIEEAPKDSVLDSLTGKHIEESST